MASVKKDFLEKTLVRDLYIATFSRNVEKLHDIIDSFEPNYLISWAESQQLLTVAIKYGELEIAKILLKKGCVIEDTMTLYPHALDVGDVELVKLLLDKDPQSLHKRLQGDTLLHMAVHKEIASMVKLLIDHGANVNLADSHGLFPLNVAARTGNVVILKLLLDSGANTESISLRERETSLWHAIKGCLVNPINSKSYKIVIKELLDAGADVNHKNNFRRTPLHLACSFKNIDIIRLLLNAGADINNIDIKGLVPCDKFIKKIMARRKIVYPHLPLPLIQHLILLEKAGLYLHERNTFLANIIMAYDYKDITAQRNIPLISLLITLVIIMCENEIDFMKKVKTDDGSVVLYDMLKRFDKMSLCSVRKSEIQLLELVILQNKFPLYTGIFKTLLKYAQLRSCTLDAAQDCLASLIDLSGFQIPFLPAEMRIHIMSYLYTTDLVHFIKGVLIIRGSRI